MKLYEIDAAIEALVDENGEITDFDALDALVMARDEKVENIAIYYKNVAAEVNAFNDEIDKLETRKKSAEAKAKSLKAYLEYALNGAKFKTAKVEVGFRKSSRVIVDDEEKFKAAYPQFFKKTVTEKISLTDIREALKTQDINGARLVESQNIQIR